MAVYACFRELLLEMLNQRAHCLSLLGRTGVLGCASVFGKSANVADAYAVGVVSSTMGSSLAYRATCMDAAIAIDDIMVAYLAKASGAMPTVDVGYGIVLAFDGGRTMDDDFCYLSHKRMRVLKELQVSGGFKKFQVSGGFRFQEVSGGFRRPQGAGFR